MHLLTFTLSSFLHLFSCLPIFSSSLLFMNFRFCFSSNPLSQHGRPKPKPTSHFFILRKTLQSKLVNITNLISQNPKLQEASILQILEEIPIHFFAQIWGIFRGDGRWKGGCWWIWREVCSIPGLGRRANDGILLNRWFFRFWFGSKV